MINEDELVVCPLCMDLIPSSDLETHYMSEVESFNFMDTNPHSSFNGTISVPAFELCDAPLLKLDEPIPSSTSSSTTTISSTSDTPETTRKSRRGAAVTARQNIKAAVKGKRAPPPPTAVPDTTRTRRSKSPKKPTTTTTSASKQPTPPTSSSSTPRRSPSSDYETYTWAGVTRVRATTLLESNNYAANGWAVNKKTDVDVDDDIDVDGNEVSMGGVQYTEKDLKRFYLADDDVNGGGGEGGEYEHAPAPVVPVDEKVVREMRVDIEGDEIDEAEIEHAIATAPPDYKLVLEALKTRLRHLEDSQATKQSSKCLICLDAYTNPCVSIVCWHVHCESCWLQTIAAKRLCPQCQKITGPVDLRRIYM
ncbi:hypothetical protein SmJEL517_g02645 [Synchytrium microbalum]|uniref:RING-type domain-containing protein n=1 Tax=Synchytrium microbalum TaxID=1806994 RepID=A0A507C9Y8_9FUNG|nr:uncharacterized protein SmJEL517_g02645 [Synchytrium microbalum]TPX34806.1 hypothetical protein SmJEL517_g02645 [Synchytrium microbalum]